MTTFRRRFGINPTSNRRCLLQVELLETRLAPANVFVVPVGTLGGNGTFFLTLQSALTAAGAGGSVTIEPGASPDPQPVNTVANNGVTIQGDPNVPGSILPVYNLNVSASNVTLTNLNLGTVQLGTTPGSMFTGNTITKSVVNNLTQFGSTMTFTQNTVTGGVQCTGDGTRVTRDFIANNTFRSVKPTVLGLTNAINTTVTQNVFVGNGTQNVVQLIHCTSTPLTGPTVIDNNTITVFQGNSANAIILEGSLNNPDNVRITNNSLYTFGGVGLFITMLDASRGNITAYVEGNRFATNRIGVLASGGGNANGGLGSIDLGGGPLGNKGGNDFRSFAANATVTNGAIVVTNSGADVVSARQSMFSVTPSGATFTQNGLLDLLNPLTQSQSFVQALYNDLLGRTGALSELNGWVSALNTQGQAAVASGILHSGESLGRIVDSLYLRFLGRAAAASERSGWVGFLQQGGTLEQVETLFLTAPEYLSHINVDFVQSLYLNILGRTGNSSELAAWNNNLVAAGGLQGVANAFVHSQEYRRNTLLSHFAAFLPTVVPDSNQVTQLVNSSQDLLTLELDVLSTPEFLMIG